MDVKTKQTQASTPDAHKSVHLAGYDVKDVPCLHNLISPALPVSDLARRSTTLSRGRQNLFSS
jgi:hypothetical protein